MITMAIAAIISLSLTSVLRSSARHEAKQEEQVLVQTETWRAADQIVADIRNGTLAPQLTQDSLRNTLPILVLNPSGRQILVQWEVTDDGLIRHTSEPVLGAEPVSVMMAPAAEQVGAEASFIYRTSDGSALSPRSASETLLACTALVEIQLHIPNPDGTLGTSQTSAAFRINPASESC